MVKFLKNVLQQIKTKVPENVLVFVLFSLITICVFDGVLKGYTLSNSNYLYSFEPWINDDNKIVGRSNYISSDMVDGIGSIVSQYNSLKKGEVPLWDYSDKLGNVGVLNILNNWFYPIRAIPWLLFGAPVGWTIEILIKFILGAMFTYLYLKKLKINNFIAIAVTIGLTFGSNNIAEHEAGFSTIPLTLPITLYYIEKLFQSNKWKDSLAVTLSSILLVGAGFISVSFYAAFWLAFYVLLRLFFLKKDRLSIIKKFLVALVFTVSIFAVAILPTADFFSNGVSINLKYRDNYGVGQLHPITLINGLNANVFGQPLLEHTRYSYGSYVNISIFVGFISFITAISVTLFRLINKKDFYTVYFTFVFLFLLFNIYNFSFENFEFLTNKLPIFHGNNPTYQKTIFQFIVAMLGALNLQYLWNIKANKRNFGKIIFIFTLITEITLFGAYQYVYINSIKGFTPFLIKNLAFFGFLIIVQILLLLFITIIKNKKIQYVFGIILILFYLTEALVNKRYWIPYSKPELFFPDNEITMFLKQHVGNGRVMSIGTGVAVPSTLSAYGLPMAAGRGSVPLPYELLLRNSYQNFYLDAPTQTIVTELDKFDYSNMIWDLTDVKFFITGKWFDIENLKGHENNIIVHEFPNGKVLERTPSPNHAYLASDGVVFSNPQDMSIATTQDWKINKHIAFDSEKYLLPNDSLLRDLSTNFQNGNIISFTQSTNNIEILVETTSPQYLLISSLYHPGWKASINNSQADIIPAYGFLSAIKIPEGGRHLVALKFQPNSFVIGSYITIISSIIAILFYTLAIYKEKHH